MSQQGPRSRKKKVTGVGEGLFIHEEGLGTGPVGDENGASAKPQQGAERPTQQQAQRGGLGNRPQQNAQGGLGNRPQQNAQGGLGNRPQQAPQSGLGNRPQQTQQTRPQQTPFTQQRPQQTQQSRPQQNPFTQQRPQQTQQSGSQQGGTPSRAGGKGFSPILIIVVLAIALFGGKFSGLFGGSDSGSTSTGTTSSVVQDLLGGGTGSSGGSSSSLGGGMVSSGLDMLTSLLGGGTPSSVQTASSASSGMSLTDLLGGSWYSGANGNVSSLLGTGTGASFGGVRTDSTKLNTSVASGSREKYTQVKGGGRDKVTILVYMCGTDLESKSAMATKDLQEMLKASTGSKVNLIVYTGGCTSWRNNVVSSKVNQVYQIKDGKMSCLVKDAGNVPMTSPSTLSSFIQFGAERFPANRMMLILWDHGSGSVTGYGYDEKNQRAGSMSLAGLNTALKDGGVKFDFIGFDACLMATVENALMCSNYADYMIASEEAEPGIGWYYTDWLNALAQNTSLSTPEVGKMICDGFVSACASSCPGQQTTLSVVDLAELAHTVPSRLTAFSKSVTGLIEGDSYKAVSDARVGSREFAPSSRVDQVDLVDLANRMGTDEGAALAKALQGAVKYNRSGSMTNAYGLSIYFPYRQAGKVDKAVSTYEAIGMDDSYSDCIRAFASVEVSGQAATGGMHSPYSILSGGSSASYGGGDMIGSLLGSFLGGDTSSLGGLGGFNFLSGRSISNEQLETYITGHNLDASGLAFRKAEDGTMRLAMDAQQWSLIHSVDRNLFWDNGKGYVDLGLDNIYEFAEDGSLVADTEPTAIAVNNQFVAYYHTADTEEGFLGFTPALLNGERVRLLIFFDFDGNGSVIGAQSVYAADVTENVAKNQTALGGGGFFAQLPLEDGEADGDGEPIPVTEGDTIEFLCDFYAYDGTYQDSHKLGNPVVLTGEPVVSDVLLPADSTVSITYRLTDIYNQTYWTAPIGG